MPPPRHAQVARELRTRIRGGDWPVGTTLPSEAHLTQEFGVSRGTLRQALAALRAEGFIGGGQGRPPVVRDLGTAAPFDSSLSFTSWVSRLGRTPGHRTLEVVRTAADEVTAAALEVSLGDPVVHLVRLHTIDDSPAMLERTTFVDDVGRLLLEHDNGSVHGALLERGVDLFAGHHTFDAVSASADEAATLEVTPGAPLLRARRLTASRTGRLLEHAEDRYLPHVVSITAQNSRARPTGGWNLTFAR